MTYQQVWDKGGFVISNLVFRFIELCSEKNLSIKNDELKSLLIDFITPTEGKPKIKFFSKPSKNYDFLYDAKKRFNSDNDNEFSFSSRFPSVDYLSIVTTLYTLRIFGGLKGFLEELSKEKNNFSMKDFLFTMHKLSYDCVMFQKCYI